jgi:ferredoxin-like protein FixX
MTEVDRIKYPRIFSVLAGITFSIWLLTNIFPSARSWYVENYMYYLEFILAIYATLVIISILAVQISLAYRRLNVKHLRIGKAEYIGSTLKICGSLIVVAHLCGCTSLTVTTPANSSAVNMPQEIKITENVGLDGRIQGPLKILVDGVDVEHFSNVNYSVPSGSTLCCLDPGAHSISVSGQTASQSVTGNSNFTVNLCPACYTSCPTGYVHPFFGVCCDNGKCDVPGSSNFGAWRFPTQACSNNLQTRDNDCINQNANGICGFNGSGCAGLTPMATQMLAVSFSLVQNGALQQIQVPIGWRNGSNGFNVWITSDNGGKPGVIIEAFSLANLRSQISPIRSPYHIFSAMHPNLVAGTTYWLVIGPAANTTVGSWNYSIDDAPSTGSTNFMVNTTPDANGVPQLAGPWVPAGGPLRPAFEIDIR